MDEARARTLLIDAMFMLETIQRARELPPFADAQKQYVALGKEIREFLQDEGVIQ